MTAESMTEQFEIVIVGGGLVGASMALALANSRYSVALLEGRAPAPLPQDESWDARVYAISPGNKQFLRDIGAWQRMPPKRLAAVHEMSDSRRPQGAWPAVFGSGCGRP
jgi:2-octaprenylphenol hydroxylase